METLPGSPTSVAILDRRPEYARLIATLVAVEQPDAKVRTFANIDDAERWIATAPSPVLLLVDVAAGGDAVTRAQAWRRARADMQLVLMFNPCAEEEVSRARRATADAAFPKPLRLAQWTRSFGAFLRGTSAPALELFA